LFVRNLGQLLFGGWQRFDFGQAGLCCRG